MKKVLIVFSALLCSCGDGTGTQTDPQTQVQVPTQEQTVTKPVEKTTIDEIVISGYTDEKPTIRQFTCKGMIYVRVEGEPWVNVTLDSAQLDYYKKH
jgi:hypothetical protein